MLKHCSKAVPCNWLCFRKRKCQCRTLENETPHHNCQCMQIKPIKPHNNHSCTSIANMPTNTNHTDPTTTHCQHTVSIIASKLKQSKQQSPLLVNQAMHYCSTVNEQLEPPNYIAAGEVFLGILLFGLGLVGTAGNSGSAGLVGKSGRTRGA